MLILHLKRERGKKQVWGTFGSPQQGALFCSKDNAVCFVRAKGWYHLPCQSQLHWRKISSGCWKEPKGAGKGEEGKQSRFFEAKHEGCILSKPSLRERTYPRTNNEQNLILWCPEHAFQNWKCHCSVTLVLLSVWWKADYRKIHFWLPKPHIFLIGAKICLAISIYFLSLQARQDKKRTTIPLPSTMVQFFYFLFKKMLWSMQ